jgi:hypothetical protein
MNGTHGQMAYFWPPLNLGPLYGQDSLGMVAVGEGIILIQEIGGTLTFWTKYPETQCI